MVVGVILGVRVGVLLGRSVRDGVKVRVGLVVGRTRVAVGTSVAVDRGVLVGGSVSVMGRLVLVGGDCIAPLAGLIAVRILPVTVNSTSRRITVRFMT